jgi:hypothetical protein
MVAAKRYGFEFKYSNAPGRSRSMQTAIQDLSLEHLWVIYPGHQVVPKPGRVVAAQRSHRAFPAVSPMAVIGTMSAIPKT